MGILPSDPQVRNKMLLGVLIVGGLGYAANEYLYQPRQAEVVLLEERLDNLDAQNATARALAQGEGVSQVEQRLAQFRDQLITVEGLIPLSEELPDLLDAISAEAQRSGVDLSLIQPVGAEQESYYTRRTYDIAVLGTYHDVGQFLTRIASLPRIITPIDLNLSAQGQATRDGQPRLEARFSIETYVLPLSQTDPETDNAE